MNLEIRQETKGNMHLLRLSGEVDAFTAPKLREVLIPLTEESGMKIIVDLADVDYIDSTGLGIFIGALKSTHNYESHIQLQGLSSRLQRLFKITGLDEVIDIETQEKEEMQ
ncbi:STAS domain-containing protein [Alkalihalobacterium alkalinitrilicum]|uniref:STAS domain-containing protein n=1 Tax=Alkalihalobacterium alkalinitrilicum TaxID=427920 RepID=UPI000995A6FE|nr:STAS domain-containing protein [Alkalihalobacterium alkalinitrilicum]